MSNYHGRRAPNVSQYIANLNLPQDVPAQNEFPLVDEGLEFLTNAEFFDFDTFNGVGEFPQGTGPPQAPDMQAQKVGATVGTAAKGPQYQFGEFQTYPTMTNSPASSMPSPSTLQGNYPPQLHQFSPGNPGEKRKASAAGMPSAADLEEASRFAAEEDKRRRNTAASARFRVKKKQREQALEKQTKEMTDKVSMLEGKVQQLEMENKWLKELITEKAKDGEAKADERAAEADTQQEESAERSTEGRTDGVGTTEELTSEA